MFRELHQRERIAIRQIINVLYSVLGVFVLPGRTCIAIQCFGYSARRAL